MPNFISATLNRHFRGGAIALARNLAWLSTDRILNSIIGLVVGVWVARYLGPESFGKLSLASAVVAIFTPFATMGLSGIVLREVIRAPKNAGSILGSSIAIQLVAGTTICAITSVVSLLYWDSGNDNEKLIFILSLGNLFIAAETLTSWFESQQAFRAVAMVSIIASVVGSILRVAVLLAGGGITEFAIVNVIQLMFNSICLAVIFARFSTSPALNVDYKTIGSLIANSWPYIFTSMALIVQARIDQLMIAQMIGEKEVGHYSVALRIVEAFCFLPIMLKAVFLPRITKSYSDNSQEYEKNLRNYFRLNFLVFLGVALPLIALAPFIVNALFGDQYVAATPILAVMSLRLLFTNMGVAREVYLLLHNFQRFGLYSMLIGTFVNVLLNLVLIPPFGGLGAIIATLLSFATTTFAVDLFCKPTRDLARMSLYSMMTSHRIFWGDEKILLLRR